MPGPLPNPQKRRRNQPTISTTLLPHAGREGRPPTAPRAYKLGTAGKAWWRWAWHLPQATRWDNGSLYFVARRAQLEDELAALDFVDGLDLADLLAGADDKNAVGRVEDALATLKRVAGGSTSLMKEMRELDNRLGLNPKALADLRWTIEEAPEPVADDDQEKVAKLDEYRARLG